MTLIVRGERDEDGEPIHYWDRTFYYPERQRTFNTTLAYDHQLEEVVDYMGFRDVVFLVWKARFHTPDRLTQDTKAAALQVGGRLVWLPRWLWQILFGVVRFTQTVDEIDDESTRVNLVIWHPWFGDCFGYKETFEVRKNTG